MVFRVVPATDQESNVREHYPSEKRDSHRTSVTDTPGCPQRLQPNKPVKNHKTERGLAAHYVFFVIHHATRMVEIAGVTPNPSGNFIVQVARNLADHVDGFLRDNMLLVLGNDCLSAKMFCGGLAASARVTR